MSSATADATIRADREFWQQTATRLHPNLPLKLTEWAERHIIVPTGRYAGRPFRHDRHPVSRPWFQALDSGRWQRYAVTGPGQNGKSLLGFVIPTLYSLFELKETVFVGIPDMRLAQFKWETDFLPVIESSFPDKLRSSGAGSKGGVIRDSIRFTCGSALKFLSARQGDAGLAGPTTRNLVMTEVDKYDEAGETSREADPIKQMEARTNAFRDFGRRIIMECTVSIPSGRIWQEITKGTNSRLYHPCPHCGEWITWDREHLVGWQGREDEFSARDATQWACSACGECFGESERRQMLGKAVLAHQGQEIVKDGTVSGPDPRTETFGLRWSAFDNPFVSTGRLGQDEWLGEASKQKENSEKSLRQFIWAIPYEEENEPITELQPEEVADQARGLPRGVVPPNTIGIAVGIDTHKRILYWEAKAVVLTPGAATEGNPALLSVLSLHVIDYRTLKLNDKALASVAIYGGLHTLKTLFDRGWKNEAGKVWVPNQVWIDSGFAPHKSSVYRFCEEANAGLGYLDHVWRPAKGYGAEQPRMPAYHAPEKRSKKVLYLGSDYYITRVYKARTVQLVHVNADAWKSAFMQGFQVEPGAPGEVVLFVPDEADDSQIKELDTYASQVTAEVQREKWVKERGMVRKWEQLQGRANHYLDCGYLNTAAADFIVENKDRLARSVRQVGQQKASRTPVATSRAPNRQSLSEMMASRKKW